MKLSIIEKSLIITGFIFLASLSIVAATLPVDSEASLSRDKKQSLQSGENRNRLATVYIKQSTPNSGELYLSFLSEQSIAGIEIEISGKDGLQISDFECSGTLKCIYEDIDNNSLKISAIRELDNIESSLDGDILLGKILTTESDGNLYIDPIKLNITQKETSENISFIDNTEFYIN